MDEVLFHSDVTVFIRFVIPQQFNEINRKLSFLPSRFTSTYTLQSMFS